MKFTVTIAKDGTPYYHVETGPNEVNYELVAQQCREAVEALDRAFAGYRQSSSDESSDESSSNETRGRFEVVD